MIINNSRAKLFADCEKAFEFKFEVNGEGVEPVTKGRPLHFGTWMHKLLEAYFNGDPWVPVHLKLCKEFKNLTDEERYDCGDLPTVCREKMLAYERKWAVEDEGHTVLGTEIEIDVKIAGHTMRVKVDMVTENPIGIWLWEHKNHKKLPDTNYRFSDIQTARYVYAVAKGTEWGMPCGIMWDYIVSVPPTKPKLVKGKRKADGPRLSYQKINTDLYTYVRAIKEYGLNPRDYRDDIMRLKERDDFFQRVPVSISKQTVNTLVKDMVVIANRIERGERRVRNVGKHCGWCDYQGPCQAQVMGGDWEGIIERSYKPRERGYSDSDEEEAPVIGQ